MLSRLNAHQIRALELADYIERLPRHRFDMSVWTDKAGGPSCIAAYACWCADPNTERFSVTPIEHAARNCLGLSIVATQELFMPTWHQVFGNVPYDERSASSANDEARRAISPTWAAATLRHFALTGEVDWRRCRPGQTQAPARLLESAA